MTAWAAPNKRLIDEGRGPALLFLHHFGGSRRSWTGVINRLSGRHRCIAPDLPGFGTAAQRPGPFTTAATAGWIMALIDDLGISDYRIVGHSMGGKIALAVAARRPRGLRGLVLLASSPPTPEPIPEPHRAQLLASWGDRAALAAVVEKISVRPLSRSDRERQVADMLTASKAAWEAWLNHGSREDISSSLNAIDVPMAVVAGGGDQIIPPELLRRELVQRVPGATMTVVWGAGHLLPVEARDEVASAILRSEPALAGAEPAWNGSRPHREI